MKLLSLLLPSWSARFTARTADVLPASLPPAEDGEAGAVDEDERPRGCGWFDSSHELQRGLSVCEHAGADSLGREMPLASWLEWQLAGWNAPVPVAQQT